MFKDYRYKRWTIILPTIPAFIDIITAAIPNIVFKMI